MVLSSPDILWKSIIQEMFPEFLLFFAPEIYEQVNFEKAPVFLEQELHKITPKNESQNRRCDSLIKLHFKNGQEKWFLVHVEVQGYYDKRFAKRMFQYYYRIFDKYDKSIYALALYTDNEPSFKPQRFQTTFFSTQLTYTFQAYKVLEQQEEHLLQSSNPFAFAILAGVYAIKSKEEKDQAVYFKSKLIRLLLQQGLSKSEIEKLFIFIENLITLNPRENQLFQERIEQLHRKEIENMGLTLEGSGFAKYWEEQGMKKGKYEASMEIAKELLGNGIPIEIIAKTTKLSLEEVKKLKEKLN